MTAFNLPAADAPAEEWGRLAVSLPGWRWMPGMLTDCGERVTDPEICYLGTLPDPDDPATEGCMVRLLARTCWIHRAAVLPLGAVVSIETPDGLSVTGRGSTLGRAAIAAAAAIGEWPEGEG